MKKQAFGKLGKVIALDIGTSTLRLAAKSSMKPIQEPSIVAADKDSGALRAGGEAAAALLGEAPHRHLRLHPIEHGCITHYKMAQYLLQHLLQKAHRSRLIKPHLLLCVPLQLSQVHARAFVDAGLAIGAKSVQLLPSTLAAAAGMELDIKSPRGQLVVDIGAGTTEIAVLSLSGIVTGETLPIAGQQFDRAITQAIQKTHNLRIGAGAAQALKHSLSSPPESDKDAVFSVIGRSLASGAADSAAVSTSELLSATAPVARQIAEEITQVLERTPPALIDTIAENGLHLCGDGARLLGLPALLTQVLSLPVRVAAQPREAVICGAKILLSQPSLLENILM